MDVVPGCSANCLFTARECVRRDVVPGHCEDFVPDGMTNHSIGALTFCASVYVLLMSSYIVLLYYIIIYSCEFAEGGHFKHVTW